MMMILKKNGSQKMNNNVKYGMFHILHSYNGIMELELDTDWIDFENKIAQENKYDTFYRTSVNEVKATFIFVDKDNTVIHMKRENVKINSGIFKRIKIVDLIRKYRKLNNQTYSLYALLQYNYSISPDRVLQNRLGDRDEFFKVITHIQDVFFEKTIDYFNSINDLIFVMKPMRSSQSQTKKIYITASKKKRKRKTRKTYL